MWTTVLLPLLLMSRELSFGDCSDIPDEKWGYVNVRPQAYMFWWLYGAQTSNPSERTHKPFVMWLQGGPGASSTGFGNFVEIGPRDVELKVRNMTWVKEANVLFVDNPVGCGFSYVTDDKAYTKNVAEISTDLITFFKVFLQEMPVFKKLPFYLIGESYGGKMISAFGVDLHHAIQSGEIECQFKGVGLGDSAISVPDIALSYGPYLYSLSLLDEIGLLAVNSIAYQAKEAADEGDNRTCFDLCNKQLELITNLTDNVDVYNVLSHNAKEPGTFKTLSFSAKAFAHYVHVFSSDPLFDLMNGPIKKKLGIIPQNVTWGGQAANVMKYQYDDVTTPVLSQLSTLINIGYKVVIYEGQLDMICGTLGANLWIRKLSWDGLEEFLRQPRKPLYPPSAVESKETGAFVKSYKNVQLYYILKAGHMVPTDAPEMALEMLKRIVG